MAIVIPVSGALAQGEAYFRPLRDSNGWTLLPEQRSAGNGQWPQVSPDHVVYVDSIGGDDTRFGTSPAQSVKSMYRAWKILQGLKPANLSINARMYLRRGREYRNSDSTEPAAQGISPLDGGANTGGVKFGGLGMHQPFVICPWPDADEAPTLERPRIILPANQLTGATGWSVLGNGANEQQPELSGDIWLMGLEITSEGHDTVPPVQPGIGFRKTAGRGSRYLIEDCCFHHLESACTFEGTEATSTEPEKRITHVTMRRCVVADTWTRGSNSTSSKGGGVFFTMVSWGLVEEMVMDKCGWSDFVHPALPVNVQTLCPKNTFSHALYLVSSSDHMLIQHNIIARPAFAGVQSRGNRQRVFNNLILEAPNGIGCGHAQNQGNVPAAVPDPQRYWRGECSYNVVLNSSNIDRWNDNNGNDPVTSFEFGASPRARGIAISRCIRFWPVTSTTPLDYVEEGVQVYAGTVRRNVIAHNESGTETSGGGIISDDDSVGANAATLSTFSAMVTENVIYNWRGPTGLNPVPSIHVNNTNAGSNPIPVMSSKIHVLNNTFAEATNGDVGRSRFYPAGGTWSENKYYASSTAKVFLSPTASNPTFSPKPVAYSVWKSCTGGDTTSILLASLPSTISDPTRNLKSYMIDVGLPTIGTSQPEVVQEFMSLCRAQRRGAWDSRLLAGYVNNHVRGGFGVPSISPIP